MTHESEKTLLIIDDEKLFNETVKAYPIFGRGHIRKLAVPILLLTTDYQERN